MATGDEGYRAPAASAAAELRDRGSRFLAILLPVNDAAAARAALEEQRRRFPDATHHCWAWRLGAAEAERSSDDGEPAGTAGVPILRVLQGAELSDVLAVVVRWYGGTKLGKGGLARAYAGAAREALVELSVERKVPTVRLVVDLPYDRIGALKRLVSPPQIELIAESYGAAARLELRVERRHRVRLEEALADLGLRAQDVSNPSLA